MNLSLLEKWNTKNISAEELNNLEKQTIKMLRQIKLQKILIEKRVSNVQSF